MRVVVPYAAREPKTRLASVLSPTERSAFARAMLADVLDAVRRGGGEPTVLATAPVDVDVPVAVDERPLTEAVNDVLVAEVGPTDEDGTGGDDGAVAVVMADLALATPPTVERLLGTAGDVAVAPGRGAGTNALVVRHPDFRVDYHGASYLDHREAAAAVGADLSVVDSHRLATDVDEPGDLVELLVHGDGRATDWLRGRGFSLSTGDGRVTIEREGGEPVGDAGR